MPDVAADIRSLDPAAYARAIALRPEDCYGFLPLDHDDITPYLFLYRDRPDYERARAPLPAPRRVQSYGPVRIEPDWTQMVVGAPEPGPSGASRVTAGAIVTHRVYPRVHRRSSTRQLNHFLPRYREMLGLRADDVYGVFPRRTRWSGAGADTSGNREWDDFWIVYRDRSGYAQGREQWAQDMDKKGGWPAAILSPGLGEPAVQDRGQGGRLGIEKERWPRRRLVMRETGDELAGSLTEKIERWGYSPEDSFGFCPDYANRSIYFAWQRR
jgi:hypothetical protein